MDGPLRHPAELARAPTVPLDGGGAAEEAASHPADAPAAPAPSAQADAVPPDLRLPERYVVRGLLGRGGFGAVYLADDLELGRPVALKVLAELGPAQAARLRREARTTARLDAPGIVKVYEVGCHQGQHYIAMQYLAGRSLAEARLDRAALVGVAREVALALHHAHERGIVHCDVKPENVLLDAAGRPHLADFGIALDRALEPTGEPGVLVGTPDLMPPEQARGRLDLVDARSDVYGLGITLYLLLTGRRPFLRESLPLTLAAVLEAEPARLRSLDPGVPRELEAVVLRCLAKEPQARYRTALELAAALAELEGGAPPPAPSLSGDPPGAGAPEALEALHAVAMWDAWTIRASRDLRRGAAPLARALNRLEALVAEHPDLAWPRLLRGVIRARLGRLDGALDDLERAIDRAPRGWAFLELGDLYLRLATLEQLAPERALAYADEEDRLGVTWDYLELARAAFDEAERREPDLVAWRPRALGALARLAEGDPAGCRAACAELLAEDPDLAEVWRLDAHAAARLGADPRPSLARALEVRRGDYEVWHDHAEGDLAAGALDAARAAADRAAALAPDWAPGLLLAARTRLLAAAAGLAPEVRAAALAALDGARRAAPLPADAARAYAAPRTRADLEAAWVDQALRALEPALAQAAPPPLRQARALLLRARHALAFGDDPRPDLDAVLALANPLAAGDPRAGDPWSAVLEAAFRARAGGPPAS